MAKSLSSSEIMKILKADGWTLARTKGSHHNFTHPTKKNVVTVPHPRKTMKRGTQKNIFKKAELEEP